ncbi:MAG: outer membrane beta-barrel protein [Candidatus Eiseniibacteriota bacterium]
MIRKLAGGILTLALMGPITPCAASELTGFGGIGLRGGTMFFTADPTIVDQASPRLTGEFVMSYNWSDHLTADITIGWDWSQLDSGTDSFFIANVVPLFPIGLRYKFQDGKRMRPFIGGGAGLYNWSILSHDLGAAKDPVTFERLRRVDLGVYGIAGVERQMSRHISMTADGNYTHIFATDEDLFPSGYSGNKAYFQVRVGVTFWFSLSERIDTGLPD